MRAVTPEVLHEDVGRVRFGGEAVVTHINTGVSYAQAIDIKGVKAVGVLW